jgi:hypothetical protein
MSAKMHEENARNHLEDLEIAGYKDVFREIM